LFPGIQEKGQRLLADKRVLIIGVGALGTGNAEILVRSGVGHITIVDRDYVEWSNLQRQQLFTEKDAENRTPKAIAAKERLEEVNGDITIDAHNVDIRMIINDAAQKYDVPWIYGSIVASYGISFTIIPGESPCLHCLMEDIPIGGLTCDTGGVISPVVQLVVGYQTTEALKILTENKKQLRRELLSFDVWENHHSSINVNKMKKDSCLSCGTKPVYPFLSQKEQTKTEVLCGRDTVQIRPPFKEDCDLETIAAHLAPLGTVEQNAFLLQFQTDQSRF